MIGYRDWHPRRWSEIPATGVALKPAHDWVLTRQEADTYVETFNRRMLTRPKQLWAVAIPVTIRFEGDLREGQSVTRATLKRAVARAG